MESLERDHIAHVLLLPYPAQGHINPVLQFAKRLVWHGLQVTLALIRSVSFNASRSVLDSLDIRLVEISDGYDAGGGFASAASIEAYLDRFRVVGSATLGEAIDRLTAEGVPVDCVVYDPSLRWAVDVACERKVRIAAFFTQPCTVCALYNEAYRRGSAVELSLPIATDGVPPLGPTDAPSFFVSVGPYAAYLSLLLQQFSNLDRVDVVLFNTFHELEPEVAKTLGKLWPTKTIGPSIPSMYLDKRVEDDAWYGIDIIKQPNRHCINWLNSKPMRSVIYIAFGSVAKLSKDQMEELAWGLRNTSKHFLWVVGPSEMDSLPHDFKRSSKSDKGLVADWCSQLDVLAHPAVGCFVTHCGWNSTLEALSLGVPMVGMPHWSDQPTNAWLIEKQWGVGVRAKPDEKGVVRRGEIELCVKEVMEGERGEELRRNAKKYKEMAIEALSEDGNSDRGIKEFIALIESK